MNKLLKKKQSATNTKGITLIALIITIIILLILAGITISSLTQSGLFGRAKEAKEKKENAQLEEEKILGEYEDLITSYIGITNVNTNNTNPEVAMPEEATIIEGDANKGIVIRDTNKNEWTWVEVPKTEVFKTAENNKDYDKIKEDLIEYAKDYREGKSGQGHNWTDEWYALDGETLVTASTEGLTEIQKELNNGCGLTYNEYERVYNKMLSSVYTNGGFWISRYEIGDSTATESNTTRTESSGTSGTAVSQANMIPYNYVTCRQAQSLASGMSTDESKTSSLIFGIQWDLTCKFLETRGGLSVDDIKTDSTKWGNYRNSSITLNRGKYNTSPSSLRGEWIEVTERTSSYLLTTGASEDTNKMNIYDLAGNEWEWTLESASPKGPCAVRGGRWANLGNDCSAATRSFENTSMCSSTICFRVAII